MKLLTKKKYVTWGQARCVNDFEDDYPLDIDE